MISVITCTNRNAYQSNIKENFKRQNWNDKELIIILNKDSLIKEEWVSYFQDLTNVYVIQLNEICSLGECLNHGIQLGKYKYIAKMDDDDYYSSEYLTDSITTIQTSGAQVVGKTSIYMYFEEDRSLQIFNPYKFAPPEVRCSENKYEAKVLMGGTLFFEKKINEDIPFQSSSLGEDAKFCEDCIKNNIPIYSGKKNHYVYIRRAKDLHTWKIENDKMKKFCTFLTYTDDFVSYLSSSSE